MATRASRIVTILVIPTLVISLAGCGDGSLSRGKAEDMIEKELNEQKHFPTRDVQLGEHHFRLDGIHLQSNLGKSCYVAMKSGATGSGYVPYRTSGTDWTPVAEEGLLVADGQEERYYHFGWNNALKCVIRLTDKGKPYVEKTGQDEIVTLRLVDGVEVEVTGVTKPSEMFGHTISTAEYTYSYKLNPLGKSLAKAGEGIDKPSNGRATFILYDDGWRLDEL